MNPQKNLVCLFFGLVCGLSLGDVGSNKELSDEEEIRRLVDRAIQLVDQPTFQGWKSEQLKQAAPRMHLGLVELWLQFRKIQKEQEEMWRQMGVIGRLSAGPCQELKDKVLELNNRVPKRMDVMEKQLDMMQRRMVTLEGVYQAESASRSRFTTPEPGKPPEENRSHPQHSSQGACKPTPCPSTGPRKGKVSTTQLADKVAVLTELLNGHNELLVELYERVSALEGVSTRGNASQMAQEGSGNASNDQEM